MVVIKVASSQVGNSTGYWPPALPDSIETIAASFVPPTNGSKVRLFNLAVGIKVAGLADGTLRLWDLCQGRCVATLEGHGDAVTAVAADFGSMEALSGSQDGTLQLWDLRERRCMVTLEIVALKWGTAVAASVSAAP